MLQTRRFNPAALLDFPNVFGLSGSNSDRLLGRSASREDVITPFVHNENWRLDVQESEPVLYIVLADFLRKGTVNLINVAASVLLLIIALSFILIILERFYTFSKEICTFVGSDLLLNFSKDSLTPSLHFLMIYIFTF